MCAYCTLQLIKITSKPFNSSKTRQNNQINNLRLSNTLLLMHCYMLYEHITLTHFIYWIRLMVARAFWKTFYNSFRPLIPLFAIRIKQGWTVWTLGSSYKRTLFIHLLAIAALLQVVYGNVSRLKSADTYVGSCHWSALYFAVLVQKQYAFCEKRIYKL